MFDFPISLGGIPDPVTFSAGFSDLQFAVAAWLGVAATVYVVLLAVMLRRRERERLVIAPATLELREAA